MNLGGVRESSKGQQGQIKIYHRNPQRINENILYTRNFYLYYFTVYFYKLRRPD